MAIPNWLHLSQNSGNSGTTIVTVTADTYSELTARTSSIIVKSQTSSDTSRTVNVTQTGREPVVVSVLPVAISAPSSGNTYTVNVTSNGSWTVSTSGQWMKVSPSSGSGNGSFTVTIYPNSDTGRTGVITVSTSDNSATVNVSQSAWSGDYSTKYLTFKVKSDGYIEYTGDGSKPILYSKNNGSTWTSTYLTPNTINVVSGDTVLVKGETLSYGGDKFRTTCQFDLEGNIMSLSYGDNFIGQTRVYYEAYREMFQNCTGLTSTEHLVFPATYIGAESYKDMFAGCTALTISPSSIGTSETVFDSQDIYGGHCEYMFAGCTSLTTAPALPSMKLERACYRGMFQGCSSLTTAPELPSRRINEECYEYMFRYCTSLTTAPALPTYTVYEDCYKGMFEGCTSLTTAPALPSTHLYMNCYSYMFNGCSSLTTAPELPANILAAHCYEGMFWGCSNLTKAPKLTAITLSEYCYQYMFKNCTGLTSAPELPARKLVGYSYKEMFAGCSNLNYIKCSAVNISQAQCTNNWVSGVSATGTFVKNESMSSWTTGNSGIPSGWTVQDYGIVNKYELVFDNTGGTDTFTITTNESWTITVPSWVTLSQYSGSGNATITVSIGQNTGDTVLKDLIVVDTTSTSDSIIVYQNKNVTQSSYFSVFVKTYGDFKIFSGLTYSTDGGSTWETDGGVTTLKVTPGDEILFKSDNVTFNNKNFTGITCEFDVQGNIMSLIYGDNFSGQTVIPSGASFNMLFKSCGNLKSAENLILPATALTTSCYQYMFSGCTGLTIAPELPATTLVNNCYQYMFSGCTALPTAPALPATTLANNCYNGMFEACYALTSAPALPATTMADSCYSHMFESCTGLTTAPVISATTLAYNCYNGMFYNCESLTTAPVLSATTMAESCYQSMFAYCTSLTTAPELPSTTLANNCYANMFQGCTGLTTAPELPATTLVAYSSSDGCYVRMFSGCSSLNYIKCMATSLPGWLEGNATLDWVYGVSATGTFVKDPSMSSWPTGNSGIPSGWTVQDAS